MQSELLAFTVAIWAWLVSAQRAIVSELALVLRAFAESGDWVTLAGFLPFGVAFGVAHALTPGHSKTVLALFVAGSGIGLPRALKTAAILSATHIAISVIIVLLALPVVSYASGEVGRADVLEDLSRGLMGVVGIWLLVPACRRGGAQLHGEPAAFGFAAGLIPCPLTLFAMTFASAHGVPEAGIAFAAMMLIGVAVVLGAITGLAVSVRAGLTRVVVLRLSGLAAVSRAALAITGVAFVLIAILQLFAG
jgi:ABC-type nickel/cobalt efflux system permease component RcnA